MSDFLATAVLIGHMVFVPALADTFVPSSPKFLDVGQATVILEDATSNSRNERSTPPSSILPASPAIAGSNSKPDHKTETAVILRTKAFLLLLGYDVGRLDGRETAKYKAAIFRYQRAHGISASGELDNVTLRSLGVVTE